MKLLVALTLLAGVATAAPMFGAGMSMGMGAGGMHGGVSAEDRVKHMKIGLYLFAPQSWVDTFNAIPAEGQQCLMSLYTGPTGGAAAKLTIDNNDANKQLIASNCSTWAPQIDAYMAAANATVGQLPASLIAAAKTYGEASAQNAEQMKTAGSQAAEQGANALGDAAKKYAQSTATFVQQVGALSDADRQQIATAFPKLQPFLVGTNATQFLTQLSQFLQTMSAGQPSSSEMHTQGEALKATALGLWEQYKTANAAGLEQAGQLLGKNLAQQGTAGLTSAFGGAEGMSGGHFGQGGGMGMFGGHGGGDMSGNNGGGSFGHFGQGGGGMFGGHGGSFQAQGASNGVDANVESH